MSSDFATFACHFVRYRFMRELFGLSLVGAMFQRKIGEISKGLPNVFGIADDI